MSDARSASPRVRLGLGLCALYLLLGMSPAASGQPAAAGSDAVAPGAPGADAPPAAPAPRALPGMSAVAALSSAGRDNDSGAPVCVAVLYTVQAGREEEAADDLHHLAALTRQEPGNLLYVVHRSLADSRQFLIYEQYRSPADLEAHRATPYFQRYSVEGLQKIAESRTGGTFTPF